jgi:hypothetical protein
LQTTFGLAAHVVPDANAVAPLPPIASELGISAADLAVYRQFWDRAGTTGGVLKAKMALIFFTKSKLDVNVLRKIWSIADTDEPKGQLAEDEFYKMCKLVALAQAGAEVSTQNMAAKAALPQIEGGGETPDADSKPAAPAPSPTKPRATVPVAKPRGGSPPKAAPRRASTEQPIRQPSMMLPDNDPAESEL